jgi:hypothetical protein
MNRRFVMSEFNAQITNAYKPLPKEMTEAEIIKTGEENINKWRKEHNPGVKSVNGIWYNFLILAFILSLIIFVGFFAWGIKNDKFKTFFTDNSQVLNNIQVQPANVTSNTNNEFSYVINNPLNTSCVCQPVLNCP